jgi:hypothetical protein
MRRSHAVSWLALSLALAGCDNKNGGTVAATQPTLVKVSLVGRPICGPFVNSGETYAFVCPPLPTTLDTGWQLTPVRTSSTANPAKTHQNRIATITVTGPSTTEIDVELMPQFNSTAHLVLAQVDPTQPDKPGEVSSMRQVGVARQDDGTTKTWTIDVNVSPCGEFRHLQIFNRSGSTRSTPLNVTMLRDTNDTECGSWGGGGVWVAAGGKPGPADPVNPKPSGPCPGGAAERVFNVCENCSQGHPRDMNAYTGSPPAAGTTCWPSLATRVLPRSKRRSVRSGRRTDRRVRAPEDRWSDSPCARLCIEI